MRYDDVAAELLAARIQALFRVSVNVDLKPFLPAALAELVAAHKLQGLTALVARFEGCLEVRVAYYTVATVALLCAGKERLLFVLGHLLGHTGIGEDAGLVLELRLVGEPALRHSLSVPPAKPEDRYGLVLRDGPSQAVLLENLLNLDRELLEDVIIRDEHELAVR